MGVVEQELRALGGQFPETAIKFTDRGNHTGGDEFSTGSLGNLIRESAGVIGLG